MKRTYQLKRSGFKRKTAPIGKNTPTGLKRGSRLRVAGVTTSAQLKREIQALVREIVIKRDGGCIFAPLAYEAVDAALFGIPQCNGYARDGHLILQADHLISRANSATYGDTRLIVCVCKGHHGWKSVGGNMRKPQYDRIVKTLIGEERTALWEKMEADRTPHHMGIGDWKLLIVALKQELSALST